MVSKESFEDEEDKSNDKWVEENLVDLIEDYPLEWIAVADQMVYATGATKAEAREKAKEILGDRKFSLYFMVESPFS